MDEQARILVVDDTPHNVKLLQDILEAKGHDVVTAENGPEALERLAEADFDLVLLDVVMPKMSGYEVCRSIRNNRRTALLPVVLVTALSGEKERLEGIEAGADDFLTKPINQQELLARVRALLHIKKLHDTVAEQAAELEEWNRTLEERVERQLAELERLDRLRGFVSPHVAEMIVAESDEKLLATHRREISVVRLELDGFAAFAESAEPEDVMEVLRDFQAEMRRLIVEHAGTLERAAPSTLIAFFNDPIETEDHPRRALELAVAMQRSFGSLESSWRRRGRDLGLRIGVDVGYATLGLLGYEKRWDYAAVGNVTNRAAGLCSSAEPGDILFSQQVASRIEDSGFEAEEVGKLTLDGFQQPVIAYRLGRERDAAEAPRRQVDPSRPLSGQRLGHYEILDKIGQGGMGTVYEAEDLRLSRHVALKILSSEDLDAGGTDTAEGTTSPERLARFEREAKTIAALNHPNIVTVYSVEEHHGLRLLSMELVSGATLNEVIPPDGLEIEEFLRLSVAMADALAAAHDRGVIHRDLKPANVMVNDEGRVKILDFGLAKLKEHPAAPLSEVPTEALTVDGAILGTPTYMAPEQLSSRPADARTDIFALGLVMYEMATGRRPFPAVSTAEWMSAVLRDPAPPAREARSDLPEAIEDILARCLRKHPANRFQSAHDLRDELVALA